MMLVRPWWRDRTPRERWLLMVLFGLLALLLVSLAVLRPLAAARARADARIAAAAAGLADVQRLQGDIRLAEQRAAAVPGSATDIISRRLTEAAMVADRMDAQGGGSVSVHVPAVRAMVLFPWLQALEQRDGLVIESLSITRNPDPSVAVTLTARRGG